MKTQIIVTILHLLWNILFVTWLDLGIAGTGISSLLTNLVGLYMNINLTKKIEGVDQICSISIFDLRVFENIPVYMKIGIPNMTILMLDWTCFEVTSVMAGYIGVKE